MDKNYDFKIKEKKWQEFWEKEGVFRFDPRKKGKIFSIDTPPPTLSGKMHLGHAFSYTHQDIVARYHRMRGKNVFYPFGVDNNGLPTEKLVEKINNIRLHDIGRKNFIELCRKTIKEILSDFIADWKNIAMSCDFSNIYSTISPQVQKISQEYFIELFQNKRVYKKYAPVLWCPECQTAIAQADLEDKRTNSKMYDIEFKTNDEKRFVISTARPELLSSCVSVFVHPDDKRYSSLSGKTVTVPIFSQKVIILKDKKVDPKKGSGAVMCCTFGDTTDIDWYCRHKLPQRLSVEKNGRLNDLAKEFGGLKLKMARQGIVEKLKKEGLLKKETDIVHTVNVHERCQTEIEILSCSQWFVKYLDLKNEFLAHSDKLKWYPPYMRKRLDNWIEGLRWDWCISRQRYFGVPIPVWHCKNCQKAVLPKISDLPVDPLHSNPKRKCECNGNDFIPEGDVLDTWMTSSLSPQIALSMIKDKKKQNKMLPMSLRPQAHDIINFWLFYTLARSYLHFKKIPWGDVMISGFVLDSKGEKMSKSKGNIVEPGVILEQYGADAMRFWASQSSLGDDLCYSEEEVKIGKRTIIKIWNASRFCLAHLKNYKPKNSDIYNSADEDKWILTKLYRTIEEYIKRMEKYEYAGAKLALDNFFWKDFCDNYLEIVKLRVYENKDEKNFRAAQFVLYTILYSVLRLYAPIMPHVTEEIYQEYFKALEKEKSIHLVKFPELNKKLCFFAIAKNFDLVIDAIAQIRKYKSDHNLSLKAPIKEVPIETKDHLKIKAFLLLVQRLMSVEKIKFIEFSKIKTKR